MELLKVCESRMKQLRFSRNFNNKLGGRNHSGNRFFTTIRKSLKVECDEVVECVYGKDISFPAKVICVQERRISNINPIILVSDTGEDFIKSRQTLSDLGMKGDDVVYLILLKRLRVIEF